MKHRDQRHTDVWFSAKMPKNFTGCVCSHAMVNGEAKAMRLLACSNKWKIQLGKKKTKKFVKECRFVCGARSSVAFRGEVSMKLHSE